MPSLMHPIPVFRIGKDKLTGNIRHAIVDNHLILQLEWEMTTSHLPDPGGVTAKVSTYFKDATLEEYRQIADDLPAKKQKTISNNALTGLQRYRVSFWRKKLILQLETEVLVRCDSPYNWDAENILRWRDAKPRDVIRDLA